MVKVIHLSDDGTEKAAVVLDDFTVEVIYSGISGHVARRRDRAGRGRDAVVRLASRGASAPREAAHPNSQLSTGCPGDPGQADSSGSRLLRSPRWRDDGGSEAFWAHSVSPQVRPVPSPSACWRRRRARAAHPLSRVRRTRTRASSFSSAQSPLRTVGAALVETFVPHATGLPEAGEATTSGCAAALAYLQAYAAPRFSFECPGYADGHQAMTTCVSQASTCGLRRLIVIADPCPDAPHERSIELVGAHRSIGRAPGSLRFLRLKVAMGLWANGAPLR